MTGQRDSFYGQFQQRNEVCEEELKAFFEREGIDHPFEPWNTDRWQEQRDELVGEKCRDCGDTENLQVHHEENRLGWAKLWRDARNEVFFNRYYKPERYPPHTAACPKCLKSSYRGRVTKTPTYVCTRCGAKFSDLILYPRTDGGTTELWSRITDWVQENAREVTKAFEPMFWEKWEAYFEGEDTVTLCQGCHYRRHEHLD